MANNYRRGSVYRLKNGTYRGAVTIGGKRRTARGATAQAVWTRLDEMRERDRAGLPIGDQTISVGDYLEQWLTEYAPARGRVKSQNTLDQYAWALRGHVIPALGKRKLRELTADHVEAMLRAETKAGLARHSVSRLRSVLVMALTHAERRDLVARNVARLAEMPADDRPAPEGRSLTVEQAQALLKAAEGDRLEALYITGLMLGLRPGELLGLCWEDVDLDTSTVQIRRTLKRETGRPPYLGDPKTPKSRRALDLPPKVRDSLAAHRRRQAEEQLIAGPEWVDEYPLVFRTEFGKPIRPEYLRSLLSKLTKSAGLGHWHPHELRHSTASLLSAAGVPLEQIADVLGHDGTRMTAKVYRHAVAPTVSAAVAPMQELLG